MYKQINTSPIELQWSYTGFDPGGKFLSSINFQWLVSVSTLGRRCCWGSLPCTRSEL